MTFRRGDTDSVILIMLLLIMACVGLGLTARSIYRVAYKNGQIDALEGTVRYTSIETDAGTFWYEESQPAVLYASRKKSEEGGIE